MYPARACLNLFVHSYTSLNSCAGARFNGHQSEQVNGIALREGVSVAVVDLGVNK